MARRSVRTTNSDEEIAVISTNDDDDNEDDAIEEDGVRRRNGSRGRGRRSSDGEMNGCMSTLPSHRSIIIHGVGHITLFGLNSRFDTEFPSELTGRVAPEELSATLQRINAVLKRHVQMSSRWLLCGLLFCCCSMGCSMWPVVCLNKRTVVAVEKTLDHENISLYHKLGLHWQLVRRASESSQRLTEYVLELRILPKTPLLTPD
ncbi:hypothetical protein WR25_21808 [Diploscapter pachys]|uniref:Golgin subfamily A member 7/ERF4 domain-containing protein n=1 Tax=Diploscapter pachys TaxID=2018661 RepID=A0A2A2L7S2_9BILA|nr:hypothetical protein WR25_21808 [Diploscapter pachys]